VPVLNVTVTYPPPQRLPHRIKGFNAQAGYRLGDGVGMVNAWYLAYELAGKTPPK
jgi:hypothetical protein